MKKKQEKNQKTPSSQLIQPTPPQTNQTLPIQSSQSALNNNHVGNAEDKSVSEFSASQNGNDTNLDDLDDFDEAGEHKGEGESKNGKGGGDASNGSKLAQVNKKRSSRYRLLVRHMRKLLGVISEEEDMLDNLCNTMHGQVGTIFKRFDADQSGELDKEEVSERSEASEPRGRREYASHPTKIFIIIVPLNYILFCFARRSSRPCATTQLARSKRWRWIICSTYSSTRRKV